MAKMEDWSFFNRPVQSGLVQGQYLSAQSTLLAAGPSSLSFLAGNTDPNYEGTEIENTSGSVVFPIGITQRFGVAQTRQHARVWEIGSERSYWISGHTVGQMTLGRMVYHGPNLLRVLYAWYANSVGNYQFPHLMGNSADALEANKNRNPHNIKVPPGFKNFFSNLGSDLFIQTTGMLIYLRDSNEESVHAVYAENAVIPTYSLGMDAGGTVLQENCQLQFERLVPVDLVNAVQLHSIEGSNKIYTAAGERNLWASTNA